MTGRGPDEIRRRFAAAIDGDDTGAALEVVRLVYAAASRGDWTAARAAAGFAE